MDHLLQQQQRQRQRHQAGNCMQGQLGNIVVRRTLAALCQAF